MGTAGNAARIASEISMAVATCGPGITVTPTSAWGAPPRIRSAVATASGSRFPSTIRQGRRPSSTAARFNNDSGRRRLSREQMCGLMRRTGDPAPAPLAVAPGATLPGSLRSLMSQRSRASRVRQLCRRLVQVFYRPYVLARIAKPSEARLFGRRLLTDPQVFHPVYFLSTRILIDELGTLELEGRQFLDMGTGTGSLAIFAAGRGA